MNVHDEHQDKHPVDVGWVAGRLASALVTAGTHEDPATARRALDRVRVWRRVLRGISDGTVRPGSRTPVAGAPGWVTLEVARGGFATGAESAGGALRPYEVETARRAGVPAERRALFEHHLTEAGLAELTELLDSGAYEVQVPEEAALLVVAWLVRTGDRLGALELLDTIVPFADRLRFYPGPGPAIDEDPTTACRNTVGDVRRAVADRLPNDAIDAMHEALTVWNPYADDLLAHWLDTVENGRIPARTPDAAWLERGAALLVRYRELAAAHRLCGKHRRPKENQTVLRVALEAAVAGRGPDPRLRGRLQYAVDSMVRRRG
ncbi:hypothetical protein GT354_16150, partial [Streptomyces sp. SID3343]|nr:hypothetical protein [Streptomyces sp. SID3343]